MRQPFPELPPELWARICAFLPSSVLKRLYSVNSLFFDLSMTERYREFNMEDLVDGEPLTALDFQRISDPFVARRVRSVVLSPDSFPSGSSHSLQSKQHSRSLSSKLTQLVSRQKTGKRHREPPLSPEETAQWFTELITNMTQVDELTIVWDTASKSNLYGQPPNQERAALAVGYLARSWQVFGENLEKLTMEISPSKLQLIFPSLPSLSRLKYLTMSIEYGSFESQNLAILLSFLNSLSDNLQSLNITVVADLDLSSLFQGLVHFPQLHSIHLTITGKFSQPAHLYHFLNLHGSELTSFYCFGNFDSPPILPKLTVRYLRRLAIDPRLLLDQWSTPVGLHDLKALTDLSLICPIPSSRVTSFLHFCASTDSPNIQRLHLCLVELTTNLLESLARSLPRLKYLSLEIIWVVDQKSVRVKPETYFPLKTEMGRLTESSFAYEMRLRSVLDPFKQWQLYDISIKRHPYICWGIMNVMAECVPSIKSFYRRDHKEMPREALMWMS